MPIVRCNKRMDDPKLISSYVNLSTNIRLIAVRNRNVDRACLELNILRMTVVPVTIYYFRVKGKLRMINKLRYRSWVGWNDIWWFSTSPNTSFPLLYFLRYRAKAIIKATWYLNCLKIYYFWVGINFMMLTTLWRNVLLLANK